MNSKIRILFIFPEILVPGGQELENIGFANCLKVGSKFDVKILNFYSILALKEFSDLPKVEWKGTDLTSVFLSKKFLKIYFKSGFKIRKSLANCFRNFPYLFEPWLIKTVASFDVCFAGITPTSLLPYIQQLCKKEKITFLYHESSIFHPKNHLFFQQMEKYGNFFISAKEKEEYLITHYPEARFKVIKQWIYLGQEEFLKIPIKKVNKVKFGSVGRVDKGKNFLVILQAIQILHDLNYEFEFSLFGDGPELEKLKNFAEGSGLSAVISFEGRFAFENRASCFENIDVFIMTSTFEGGPLVILEAMAAGKPVISTSVGDVPNRVFQNKNGYLLPVTCSAAEVADCMKEYVDQKDLTLKHGVEGREIYLKYFERETAESIFKDAILQVMKESSSEVL